jgi:hypothetical protein
MTADLGSGKTALSLRHYNTHNPNGRLLIVCPASKRDSGDWEREIERFLDYTPDFAVMSYEGMAKHYADYENDPTLTIIADECLTGETAISTPDGYKQIADVNVGDVVESYNHKTQRTESKRVVSVRKRQSDEFLYCVFTQRGVMISSYNHKHWVNGEYTQAQYIKRGDTLYGRINTSGNGEDEGNSYEEERTQAWEDAAVRSVRRRNYDEGTKSGADDQLEYKRQCLLLRGALENGSIPTYKLVREEAGEHNQLYEVTGESSSHSQEEWDRYAYMGARRYEKTPQGWQRGDTRATEDALRGARQGLDIGTSYTDEPEERVGLPVELQSGHRKPMAQGGGRGGRTEPQLPVREAKRQEERRYVGAVRVESVAVLKRTDLQELGLLRDGDNVYCLEVEHNHNYFANGILTHNCHMLAQPTTKRSKAFLRIARSAGQWILLSGTPTPNSWRSAATYAILTGLSRNKTDFWRRFVIEDRSRGFPLILGYREQDTLNEWWKQVSKPLVRPLLPSQSLPVEPDMRPATKRAMKQAIKERVTASGDLLDTPSSLFAHLRQLQVSERTQALHNVLEGTDENVVVWYNFNSERQAILDLLAKNYPDRTVYEQSGHASTLPDRAEWSSITNSVTIAQYQSASAAIELVYASVNVYFSPSTSYANYEQSKGRTRRNGQTKTVLYYHISVQSSPDRKIWGTLKERRDFNQTLISQWYNELSTGK